MVSWHHWLSRHESEQTPGDSEGQEAWHAAVHRVTKSSIQLSDWTITASGRDPQKLVGCMNNNLPNCAWNWAYETVDLKSEQLIINLGMRWSPFGPAQGPELEDCKWGEGSASITILDTKDNNPATTLCIPWVPTQSHLHKYFLDLPTCPIISHPCGSVSLL